MYAKYIFNHEPKPFETKKLGNTINPQWAFNQVHGFAKATAEVSDIILFWALFEFSFNSKMSSLCIEPKNKITEHYKSQQLTACTACFMHYIIQCNAQCNALCNTNCELSLIDRVQSIVYWFQIGSINYSMHIYMCTCILRDIFTSIFSSSFVGPNIPQRRGHYAAGVGKAEATQGKETFEHQRCPDQGGHD